QRRHFITVWSAHTVDMILAWLFVWAVLPPGHSELMFLVYPVWLLLLAQAYLAFASEIGAYYAYGGVLYSLALFLPLVLTWAPVIVAGFMSVNLTVHGLLLYRGIGMTPVSPQSTASPPPSSPDPTPASGTITPPLA